MPDFLNKNPLSFLGVMDTLFVNVYKDATSDATNTYSVDTETLIILSVFKLIDTRQVQLFIKFLPEIPPESTIIIDLQDTKFKSSTELPDISASCIWPVVINEKNVTAGLCSVVRLLIKKSDNPEVRALLGFREACLLAHSESSIWTRFCEVDIICTTKKLLRNEFCKDHILFLPKDVALFEFHMSKPVRMHNVYKAAREKNNDKDLKSSVPIAELNLSHSFSEGTSMTLADIILFQCFRIFLHKYPVSLLRDKIPLTINWFQRMERSGLAVLKYKLPEVDTAVTEIVEPYFIKHSLYTADPTRYRPEKRILTRQNHIDCALKALGSLQNEIVNEFVPLGYDVVFNWAEIPTEANPTGGALPAKRANRKQEQLENLAKAVVKITGTKPYKIVDFCSGSGHLGILLAVLLPNCEVILIENKERSLSRARERITNLRLKNIVTVQSNLDYFQGNFDIGITLHACGVATDLVIQSCINNRAHFVVCPCCYGGIKDCHHLKYPRSERFQKLDLGYENYLSLAHAADQTHDADNVKTKQGFLCMDVVDTDRKLFAESCGYEVHLGKLQPTSCTNKNNLLVGLWEGEQ